MSTVERYVERLGHELEAVGIPGRLRRRILAEVEDHLGSDPAALERFGEAQDVACQFGDELGTASSLRGAVRAFGALAVAGLLYGAAFVSMGQAGSPDLLSGEFPALGVAAAVMLILAPQVAFVAGSLAFVRALRRRGARVCPAAEVDLLNRRTGVALMSGLATMAALALYATEFHAHLAGWWTTLALTGSGLAGIVLIAAAGHTLATARVRPTRAGPPGDLFDDLGTVTPARLRDRPWMFASVVAAVVAGATFLDGVVAADEFDGALRAVLEAAACLTGFAVLGRYLGLRR